MAKKPSRPGAVVERPGKQRDRSHANAVAKNAAPCAAPVRSSATVSAIIFWMPISISPVDRRAAPGRRRSRARRASGQISGKAIQRTIAATPTIAAWWRRNRPKTPRKNHEHADLRNHRECPEEADQRIAEADRLPVDRDESVHEAVAAVDQAGAGHEQHEVAVEQLGAASCRSSTDSGEARRGAPEARRHERPPTSATPG